jgi:hypothetical protein
LGGCFHCCCVSVDVCFVLYLFFVYTCVCVCLKFQGPVRECPRAGRLRAALLIHTTCDRS